MPAYSELDAIEVNEVYEIRTHSVNRQDANKVSYDWPKLKIMSDQAVDFNELLENWYAAVGGNSNGTLADLLQNGLNHAISVAKDPSRISSDPRIKEFKASFRKALGANDLTTLEDLKAENEDLFVELRDEAKRKIEAKANLLG